MKMEIKESIFDALTKLAFAKGFSQSEERLKIYVEILSRFKQENVLNCISYFLLREKFFPDISELVNYLDPKPSPKEIAASSVGVILEAVGKFGPHFEQSAKETIGTTLWNAVKSYGGWKHLCSINIDSSVKAQLRDAIASQMAFNPQTKKEMYLTCSKFISGELDFKQKESVMIENKSVASEKEINDFFNEFLKQEN
jgi:hypothetical protein